MSPATKKSFIIITAVSGIAGCVIDLGGTFIFGNRIDGYRQIKDTMSQRGMVSGPVAKEPALPPFWMQMAGPGSQP